MIIVHSGSNVFYLYRAMNARLGYTRFQWRICDHDRKNAWQIRDARDAHSPCRPPPHPHGPISFIFMQFLANISPK